MFLLLLSLSSLLPSSDSSSVCNEVSFSSFSAHFGSTKRVERVAVSGTISAFHFDFSLEEDSFQPVLQPNGLPLLLYSSPSHDPVWTSLDILSRSVRLRRVFESEDGEEGERAPLLMLTLCESGSPSLSFDDSPYRVDTMEAGLVSMYENELRVVFRSYRSSLLFFSSAPQGDLLIAQSVQGRVQIIFDFGSLSPSEISGGRALDDGKWHEFRWIHHFDSVELYVDGVLTNRTSPSGLYRKLDLNNEIWIGGRSSEDVSLPLSLPIQSTLRGCLHRVQLNSINLLSYAPPDLRASCIMADPPSITLFSESSAIVPFTFLPFSFEFRLVSTAISFMSLRNASGDALVTISVDETSSFLLTSNSTKHKQKSNPGIAVVDGSWHSFSLKIRSSRMEIEVDGMTILWVEGPEVRWMSVNVASIVLAAEGCYRSTTLDLQGIPTEGRVERGTCALRDRCTPNPCVNGGSCIQSSLQSQVCKCVKGYNGNFCQISEFPRSCEEYYFLKSYPVRRVSKLPKQITIDVDGGESILPMVVECSIRPNEIGEDTVVTRVEHQMKEPLRVSGDTRAGQVRMDLNYGIDLPQMEKLVDSFEICSQWMRYECKGGARLMTWEGDRSPSSWYSTRHDKQGLQWGSAPPFSRMCPCAIYANCSANKLCNCESGMDGVDEGNNTYSQLLPITSLFVGGTTVSSSVAVTIGPLICHTKLSFESVTFEDRSSRLTGQSSFQESRFSLLLHLKFTYRHMIIFTWESYDSKHWFNLHVHDGQMVGEVSIGGESFQVKNEKIINDGEWHEVQWEATSLGQILRVDKMEEEEEQPLVLPSTFNWTIGSKSHRNGIGFAGVIRNVYLNGNGLPLAHLVRESNPNGVHEGERGKCNNHRCGNGGKCVDHYDSYSCNCTLTPFGGEYCTREHSMWIGASSSLSIPWQNPSHTSMCHRLAIETASTNVSLIRSKALFGDASFNITLTTLGRLSISLHDGFSMKKAETFAPINVSDEIAHDISFCASPSLFKMTIDEQIAFNIAGNFSFFKQFDVWQLMDENFVGCLSRLQIGYSFPLKDPKTSRLKTKGDLTYGKCPSNIVEPTPSPSHSSNSGINIGMDDASSPSSNSFVSTAGVVGVILLCLLFLSLSLLICYMRNRPEGVYNTHEGSARPLDNSKYSPSKSEEPLVHPSLNPTEKEYFC